MKKVKLADVLWEAANVHLAADSSGDDFLSYSCNAVKEALGHNYEAAVMAGYFLEELGVDQWRDSYNFGTRVRGPKRQGVRYMWLLLAMHVAEDEGIEVEVEQ